jgi:hypothetical protein
MKSKTSSPELQSFVNQEQPGTAQVWIRLDVPAELSPAQRQTRIKRGLTRLTQILGTTPAELGRFGLVTADTTSLQLQQIIKSKLVRWVEAKTITHPE